MKAKFKFEAEERGKLGRGAARELRRSGRVPGVLYSNKVKPVSFSLASNELGREYLKGSFRSKLIELNVGKETYFALPREIQFHPVSSAIEHIDFLQVEADSKVTVAVPVVVTGSERSIGLRRGGSLNVVRHTVKLDCTPENIPAKVEIDITEAQIGDSIHISAVKLPEGVEPMIKDRDFTLVTIAGRLKKEETTDEAAPAADEVPTEGDAAAAEGGDE
jgi:large subunit ribosomal protein L25